MLIQNYMRNLNEILVSKFVNLVLVSSSILATSTRSLKNDSTSKTKSCQCSGKNEIY